MCCFLLPFLKTCASKAEIERKEKAKQDSLMEVARQDSLNGSNKNTIPLNNIVNKSDTSTIKKNIVRVDTSIEQTPPLKSDTTKTAYKESGTFSEQISKKYNVLKPILTPKEDTYTGIAMVIDSTQGLVYLSVLIPFILLFISLIVKFIEVNARRTIVLLEFFILTFLLLLLPFSIFSEILWGYWVCFSFAFILILYDIYLLILNKRLTKNKL